MVQEGISSSGTFQVLLFFPLTPSLVAKLHLPWLDVPSRGQHPLGIVRWKLLWMETTWEMPRDVSSLPIFLPLAGNGLLGHAGDPTKTAPRGISGLSLWKPFWVFPAWSEETFEISSRLGIAEGISAAGAGFIPNPHLQLLTLFPTQHF